jgi:hypothetical protein
MPKYVATAVITIIAESEVSVIVTPVRIARRTES